MAAKMKMFTMGRADFAAYEYLLKQTEAVNWIEEVLNEKLSNPDLKTSLSDGVILCKVAAKMYPDDMKKWNGPGSYRYKMIENIELFLAVAEKQGVAKKDLFEPPHLFDKKNMPRVLYTLQKFATSAEAKGFSIKWKVTENPPDFTSKEIQEAKMLENVAPDKRNLWGDKKSEAEKPADDKEAKEREEERKREIEKEREREAKERQREAEEKAQLEILAKLQAEQEAKRKKEEEERKKREQEEEEKRKQEEAAIEAKRKAEADAIENARQKKQKELEAQLIQKQKEAEEVELKRKQKRAEEEELEVEKKFDGKKKLTQVRDDLANLEKSIAKNEFENTTLHEASTRQMDDVVRYMLQIKKADPNVTNANNDIPLHLAVQYPSQKIVEYLIDAGSNVNNLNRDADTPLHKACSANASIDVVKKLLDKGADLNSRNMNLETPLLLTVSSSSSDPKEKANQTSVVTELIKRGVDVNVFSKNEDTALHLAAQRGDLDLVNVLSKAKGADLNARNKRFATPLQVAIENERLEVAKRLIDLGADIHVQRNDGWSPLYTASYNGDVQSATLLLSKGADVNVKNDEGWSPLHATCSQGHLELTKVLVRDYKAKVNILNDQGTSPVFHSVCAGKRQITAFLVEEGAADVDLSKDNGWKPIHAACYNEFEKLTNYLVDHGASLSSPCKEINNYTPLHILISTEEPPMSLVKLLIKKGAKLNVQNSTGGTPLHLAAFWGHDEVAKYLVDATADLNVKNDKGRTALDVSALYGHKKIAELLAAKMKKPVPEMQKRQIKTKEMVLPTDAPAPAKS